MSARRHEVIQGVRLGAQALRETADAMDAAAKAARAGDVTEAERILEQIQYTLESLRDGTLQARGLLRSELAESGTTEAT